jgi:Fe-S cluster biogenesis protein NfuA
MNSSAQRQLSDERMQELDRLIGEFERQADPAARAQFDGIMRALMALYGAGLRRTLDLIADADTAGPGIIDALAADPVVSNMLLVHDLHPHDRATRIAHALSRARPYLASHGGHVELTAIMPDGAVHLRLEGSCHGCPSSRVTLRSLIEQEIYAACPEVTAIVVEGLAADNPPPSPAGFVPIERLGIRAGGGGAAIARTAAP